MSMVGYDMSEGLGVPIRRTVATAVTAAFVAVSALAGCSDDESDPPDSGLPSKTESTDPTTATPTPTEPSPTGPQAPPLPAAANAGGKQGAKAFVAYYIELLNYAQHTGDSASLETYGPTCSGCMAFARLAKSLYADGGWLRGGTWTPIVGSWFTLRSGRGFLIGVNIDVAASRQLPQPNTEVKRYRHERIGRDFRLIHNGASWRIVSMEEPR